MKKFRLFKLILLTLFVFKILLTSSFSKNEISIIVKNDLEVGLCGIPVQFRLEPEELDLEVLGVISSSLAFTCDTTSANSIIPGIASVNYYNVTNGIDNVIAEIQDPNDNTVILYSDTLKIETIGSTLFVDDVTNMYAGLGTVGVGGGEEYLEITIIDSFSIKVDSLFAKSVDLNDALIPEIPFQFIISEFFFGEITIYLFGIIAG